MRFVQNMQGRLVAKDICICVCRILVTSVRLTGKEGSSVASG
jgi:hypothetical protein